MKLRGWHINRSADVLTLSRRPEARFDIEAKTTLPRGDLFRLAVQIRQDVWRGLQHLRGFTPVVELRAAKDLCYVRAGGGYSGKSPISAADREILVAILTNQDNRGRWKRWADRGTRS